MAAGGSSAGERRKVNRSCDRCGHDIETAEHRLFGCKANQELPGELAKELILKTDWLCKVVAKAEHTPRCLYLRAILPAEMSTKLLQDTTDMTSISI